LKVAVRPLTKRTFLFHGAARIERLAQINHKSTPLVLGEFAIEIDRPPDANGQSKHLARSLGAGGGE